jgi:hypothetical protein
MSEQEIRGGFNLPSTTLCDCIEDSPAENGGSVACAQGGMFTFSIRKHIMKSAITRSLLGFFPNISLLSRPLHTIFVGLAEEIYGRPVIRSTHLSTAA